MHRSSQNTIHPLFLRLRIRSRVSLIGYSSGAEKVSHKSSALQSEIVLLLLHMADLRFLHLLCLAHDLSEHRIRCQISNVDK